MQVNLEIFKTNYTETFDFLLRLTNITAVLMHSRRFNRVKSIEGCFKVRKFTKPYDFLPIPTIKYYRT